MQEVILQITSIHCKYSVLDLGVLIGIHLEGVLPPMGKVLVKLSAKHGAHSVSSVLQAASLDGLSFLPVEARCVVQGWYHVLVESIIHDAKLLPFLVIPQSINACLEQRFLSRLLQV